MRRASAWSRLALLPLLASCAGGPAPALDLPRPADLPARIALKTARETFTHEWHLALRDGRVWRRPNPDTTGRDEPWRLLPQDGRPAHRERRAGAAITALSADGLNLIAVDEDGLVHYTKLDEVAWVEDWGLPPRGSPLHAPRERLGLAISHRGPLAGGYEDIDGNSHAISAGVTTLYLLERDALRYADPWLPGGFDRRIALPLRDRLIAVGLSASASTVMVIDARGRVFTRLADYDTLGENPVLPYTYVRGRGTDRVLPPEGWAEQPPLPGRVTARVTILQTGAGNAARELRVEGVDASGAGGYFAKSLRAGAWTFVPVTDAPVTGPLLDPAAPDDQVLRPRRERDLAGRVESPSVDVALQVELRDFHPVCPPAVLRLSAGGARLDVPLHMKDTDREGGRITSLDGALLVPTSVPAPLRSAVDALFGDASIVECEVLLEPDGRVVLERGLAEKQLGRPFTLTFR